MKKYILRRKNEDTEGDKYSYLISCNNVVEVTTPFKDKATVYSEHFTVNVVSKDWKFIKVLNKLKTGQV